jgi:hypothetical protein
LNHRLIFAAVIMYCSLVVISSILYFFARL